MQFKDFILNENENYLMQRVGDILSSLQSTLDESESLGNRQIIKVSQAIVNQIRVILNDYWPDEQRPILKALQKIGVALMKSIDGSEDMRQTIASAVKVLESAVGKQESPINDLGSQQSADSDK